MVGENPMGRTQESNEMNESLLSGFRRKSGQYNLSLIKKNIDFSLVVKSFGEQLYLK